MNVSTRAWITYDDTNMEIDMNTLDISCCNNCTEVTIGDIYPDKYVFRHYYSNLKIWKYKVQFNGHSRDIIFKGKTNSYKVKISVDWNCPDYRTDISICGPDLHLGYGALVSSTHESLLEKY
jgi:hypothetical protein